MESQTLGTEHFLSKATNWSIPHDPPGGCEPAEMRSFSVSVHRRDCFVISTKIPP